MTSCAVLPAATIVMKCTVADHVYDVYTKTV